MKENVEAAEVIGVDTTRVKIIAAVISAALTAMLGTLYAQFMYFFDPDAVFGIVAISVRAAIVTILGGAGTIAGPIIGAFFIIPVEELANSYLSSRTAGLSQLAFGLALIGIILIEPRGILVLIKEGTARLRRRHEAQEIRNISSASAGCALDDVSLDGAERSLGFGPNGAGKSTLLTHLSVCTAQRAGPFDSGEDITGLKPHKVAARMTKTFQNVALFARLLDNVLIGLAAQQCRRGAGTAELPSVSPGSRTNWRRIFPERARVEVARSCHQPKVLLLDDGRVTASRCRDYGVIRKLRMTG